MKLAQYADNISGCSVQATFVNKPWMCLLEHFAPPDVFKNSVRQFDITYHQTEPFFFLFVT